MPTNRESEAVRIKREAQAQIDREAEGMTPAERDAYINRRADEFAERLGPSRSRARSAAAQTSALRTRGRQDNIFLVMPTSQLQSSLRWAVFSLSVLASAAVLYGCASRPDRTSAGMAGKWVPDWDLTEIEAERVAAARHEPLFVEVTATLRSNWEHTDVRLELSPDGSMRWQAPRANWWAAGTWTLSESDPNVVTTTIQTLSGRPQQGQTTSYLARHGTLVQQITPEALGAPIVYVRPAVVEGVAAPPPPP